MSEKRTERKRILLIDEDAELLKGLAKQCRKIGLEVDSASDALTAVTLLQKKDPDLICLDGSLPGGNGLRLCEMVLASPDDVTCPVIILTSDADDARSRQLSDMCVYHIQKRQDLWRYLEPVIFELVDVAPLPRRSSGEERDLSEFVS